MTRSRSSSITQRRSPAALIVALVVLAMTLGSSSMASAGGWAVASLDPAPAMEAGQQVTVGFTILQHGVTPVDLLNDASNVVGIEIREADGSVQFFPATGDGTVGHYLSTVQLPAAGSYEWSVRMGWFGPQSLGTLEVGRHSTTSNTVWPTARLLMLALTIGLAAVAMVDVLTTRRRSRLALP